MQRRDIVDFISDDIVYLRKLLEKKAALAIFGEPRNNALQQAHVARLIVVFGYTALEAQYRLYMADVWPDDFPDAKKVNPDWDLLGMMAQKKGFSIDATKISGVKGLKALRDLISHGLMSANARDFDKKRSAIERAGLPTNGMKLDDTDSERVLEIVDDMTNALGSLWLFHGQ